MTDKIILQIPKELKKKLEKRIKQTNFKSIQDYLLFVIEQIISDITTKQAYTEEEEKDIIGPTKWEKGHFEGTKGYTKEEEEELQKDLEEAGYM